MYSLKTYLSHTEMIEKQQMLASYMQSVLIDYDNDLELEYLTHCLQPVFINRLDNEVRPILPPEA